MSTDKKAGGSEALDPVRLKQTHAITYLESTSELKDDFPALLAVMKTGTGALTRQEAAFLTWYHALDDKQTELVAGGAYSVCLALLDVQANPDVGAAERTCAAGILMALARDEDLREGLARARGPSGSLVVVLHTLLHDSRDKLRLYVVSCLQLLAEVTQARSLLLRAMDNRLIYSALYCDLLRHSREGPCAAHTVTQLAMYLTSVLDKRDDLKAEAVEAGMLEALLETLQYSKSGSACTAVLALLLSLLEDRTVWPRVLRQGGIQLLVDILGPPPATLLDWESKCYRDISDPVWAAEQEEKRQEIKRLDMKLESLEKSDGTATPGRSLRSNMPSRNKSTQNTLEDAEKALEVAGVAHTLQVLSHDLVEMMPAPPKLRSELLTINTAGLKWKAITGIACWSNVAGCLYTLAQSTECMSLMSLRLAVPRLSILFNQVMAESQAGGDAGKKKGKAGKKKGLSLNPEQTVALIHITGCLKFLSLINANRYRLAKYMSIKDVICIYEESSHTLLRRNAQVILTNLALLAENGQQLLTAGLPEEFLISRPMRLHDSDVELLVLEFPDAGLFVQLDERLKTVEN